ncbi:hypothetical protein [Legionella parisiensis]|uniref:hypothetical protein n=1 Tax=Legionella parisiensis TaxID=45071 RepID=UPI0007307042|nr:hypothetical protein [Legionella parisiensis]KTD40487.1 hypothetical protein Lpar_1804 [Legionella parisiensis]STX77078.1 Uncharacterised protein [Legionella parisiensis]
MRYKSFFNQQEDTMDVNLLEKITREKAKIAQFIDSMREVFEKTPDEDEKANRLEVFDTLLLLATYAQAEELENEFQIMLPYNEHSDSITYLCQQLREINGFCQCSFSDQHSVYQDLLAEITPEKKQAVRELLSKEISELIFEKTNTGSICLGI